MARNQGIKLERASAVEGILAQAERGTAMMVRTELSELATALEADARAIERADERGDARRLRLLAKTLKDMGSQ
jgi:hypothetical protein